MIEFQLLLGYVIYIRAKSFDKYDRDLLNNCDNRDTIVKRRKALQSIVKPSGDDNIKY